MRTTCGRKTGVSTKRAMIGILTAIPAHGL
jgi:hypothetical protein